ncbi:pancreatic lipase-related protein 2-like isoform X2 [Macrobrachium nipponense]|uniref:pancreatic lipase-related protein 2-like isoform X2 n=1 Tax=Macrobrachium nipponense TaxID=159736 RepID=UPI0030C812F3
MLRFAVLSLVGVALVVPVAKCSTRVPAAQRNGATREYLRGEPNDGHPGNLSDVRFLLWTRSNPGDEEYYQLLPGNLTNLNESPLDPSLPLHMMYHGYKGNGEQPWIRMAKTRLLELYNCNVISVDWQTLVLYPWYNLAYANTFKIANYTADLIDWINAERGLQPSQIHIVGHSLGSHAAGLTGKCVGSGQVARVTGLDPAAPWFYDNDSEHRIDKSDAKFVDIIHTNSGSVLEGCIALIKPLGHVDFFPNGGHHQPGCEVVNGSIIDDWMDLFEGCSHSRATELWIESISATDPDKVFKSWPCSDYESYMNGLCQTCGEGCLEMGFHTAQSLSGEYFLRTNTKYPFARGDKQSS